MFYVEPPQEQILRLDDFKLLSTILPAKPVPAGVVLIADYEPPIDCAIFVGGKHVVVSEEEAKNGGKALKIDYTLPAQTLMVVMHQVRSRTLESINAIQFRVKSSSEALLFVMVEEIRGTGDDDKTGYQTMVSVSPSEAWETITIPLSDFAVDQNAVDPNGQLDPELVGSIGLADGSAVLEGKDTTNTLWLDDLVGLK